MPKILPFQKMVPRRHKRKRKGHAPVLRRYGTSSIEDIWDKVFGRKK